MLEQELHGFAKALDTSSDGLESGDDDDDPHEPDGCMEREVQEQMFIQGGDTPGKDTNNAWKQNGSGSRSLLTPRHSPTAGQLLALDELTIAPTLDEVTQLGWGTSKLVDGQQYWFDIRNPAELHWIVPLELAASLRRLRAERHRKASVAAGIDAMGTGFQVASRSPSPQ